MIEDRGAGAIESKNQNVQSKIPSGKRIAATTRMWLERKKSHVDARVRSWYKQIQRINRPDEES